MKLPKKTPHDAMYFMRLLRAEHNLSQAQAAGLFSISPSHWSLLEEGKRNASPRLAEELAKATGAPITLFLMATDGRVAS